MTHPNGSDTGRDSREFDEIRRLIGHQPSRSECRLLGLARRPGCWGQPLGFTHMPPEAGEHVLNLPGAAAGAIDIGDAKAILLCADTTRDANGRGPESWLNRGVGSSLRELQSCGSDPAGIVGTLFLEASSHAGVARAHELMDRVGGYAHATGVPVLECQIACPAGFGSAAFHVMTVGTTSSRRLSRRPSEKWDTLFLITGCGRTGCGRDPAPRPARPERHEHVQQDDAFETRILMECLQSLYRLRAVSSAWPIEYGGIVGAAARLAVARETGVEVLSHKMPQSWQPGPDTDELFQPRPNGLLVTGDGARTDEIRQIVTRWGLNALEVGRASGYKRLVVKDLDGHNDIAIPIEALREVPSGHDTTVRSGNEAPEVQTVDCRHLLEESPPDLTEAFMRVFGATKSLAWNEFARHVDATVQCQTLATRVIAEANLIRIRETPKALAVVMSGQPRWCHLDLEAGLLEAAEFAARRLRCVGARPLGMTACIDVDSRAEASAGHLIDTCREGLKKASDALNIALVSSSWRASDGPDDAGKVFASVGMVGMLDDRSVFARNTFPTIDLHVFLVGHFIEDLTGSAYVAACFGDIAGRIPKRDIDQALRLHDLLQESANAGCLQHARAVGPGGLAHALAASCLGPQNVGVRVSLSESPDIRIQIFDELSARAVVSVASHDRDAFTALSRRHRVACSEIGVTGGERLVVSSGGQIQLSVSTDTLKAAAIGDGPNPMA